MVQHGQPPQNTPHYTSTEHAQARDYLSLPPSFLPPFAMTMVYSQMCLQVVQQCRIIEHPMDSVAVAYSWLTSCLLAEHFAAMAVTNALPII